MLQAYRRRSVASAAGAEPRGGWGPHVTCTYVRTQRGLSWRVEALLRGEGMHTFQELPCHLLYSGKIGDSDTSILLVHEPGKGRLSIRYI